ncbi:hypothetical protein BH23ACT3_BH23ACT3_08450 [soil metagenome]
MSTRPDWYPDPSGRYEFRYHNGSNWTADVSSDGQRYVDSVATSPPPNAMVGSPTASSEGPGQGTGRGNGQGNGIAIAGLTCGIVAIAFGWLPVVFVLGAVLAVLAVAFGLVGLRRSRRSGSGRGRGFAVAGIVTGLVGMGVAVAGLLFTIAVFRALDRYENPAAHTVSVTRCQAADGTATVAGTLRNDGTQQAGFTVRVDLLRAGSGVRVSTTRGELTSVAPGATAEWEVTRQVSVDDVECSEPDVSGPLPFGVDPG